MYRSFDKDCLDMLAANGYRYIVIGNRISMDDDTPDFEVIPSMDEAGTHPTLVFDINSPEALYLVTAKQPVGLYLDVRYAVEMAMAA